MAGSRIPFLPMTDVFAPANGFFQPFELGEYLHSQWQGEPRSRIVRVMYNDEYVDERVPDGSPMALGDRNIYDYLVTILAPESLGTSPIDPRSALVTQSPLAATVMSRNDHFNCGLQGSLNARGQHHCDHFPWCNIGYCGLLKWAEDEKRLRSHPTFLITTSDFPWQATSPGLWQIDANHHVILAKVPGIKEIIACLNSDLEHELTDGQKTLIKAFNYNVYFIPFEDGYNFAFVMAVEQILLNLRPEAVGNFVDQIVNLYDRGVCDMSLIFKKMVHHGEYDIQAVADSMPNGYAKTLPFHGIRYGKITSIEVMKRGSNFDQEFARVAVCAEVVFCINSGSKHLSRQAMSFFGPSSKHFPAAREALTEPVCLRVTAGERNRVAIFQRYDRSLKGVPVRNYLRYTKPHSTMVKLIANCLVEDIIPITLDENVSRLGVACPSLNFVPYSFWSNTSPGFNKELDGCLEAMNIINPKMFAEYEEVANFIVSFRNTLASVRQASNDSLQQVLYVMRQQTDKLLNIFVRNLKLKDQYGSYEEVFRHINMRRDIRLSETHAPGVQLQRFRSYPIHALRTPRAERVMAVIDRYLAPYVPAPQPPLVQPEQEGMNLFPNTPNVHVPVQVPGSSAEQNQFENWSQNTAQDEEPVNHD
ncbi:hypothetical protein HDE_02612 [Halotydeus destructor]|nr:hypothetical protein HDE_02612 [Halotydeus destructor]